MLETLIRRYYDCFNQRRFSDAAALFAADAVVEQLPMRDSHRGGDGYLIFALGWTTALPDAVIEVEEIVLRGEFAAEAHLRVTGTHDGSLDLGGYGLFRASGVRAVLRLRELLEFDGRRFTYSSLSFDVHELVRQLSVVDYSELMIRLQRIRNLTDVLTHVSYDASLRRETAERLGPELDAARRALRPHFYRP